MLTKKEEKISKTASYALRHKPEEFDLVLDNQGFVDLSEFIEKINARNSFELTEELLQSILERSDKTRWEVVDGKIRAVYGHSIKKKIEKKAVIPPEFLYHGTAHRFLDSILQKGLIPKGRQYVHLSQDKATAMMVGKRRDPQPVIFKVKAHQAEQAGIQFYQELEGIWLSDSIAPEYLEIEE